VLSHNRGIQASRSLLNSCTPHAMQNRALVAGLTTLLACSVPPADNESTQLASSGTTSFQDGQLPTTGYAGTRDTMLEGLSPNNTHGSDTAVSADGDDLKEILISWDITAIPATAVVDAVTITLEVSDKSSETFSFYEAKQAWNETKASWNLYDTAHSWQV